MSKSNGVKPNKKSMAAQKRGRDRDGTFRKATEGRPLPQPAFDTPREVQRGFISLLSGILLNSDIAYRRDRRYQQQMRRDPDVMGPLNQRLIATSLLEWDIVAEDEEDEAQVEQAKMIKTGIEHNMRRQVDMLRHVSEAIWYGPSAVNIIYARTKPGDVLDVIPQRWIPFHPDTLVFSEKGDLGMRVGQVYKGTKIIGHDSPVHMFTPRERAAVVLHTFMPQGPDYNEPFESRYMWSGRGMRDIVWWSWLMKMTAQQLWMTWAERYGMGNRIGKYPLGDNSAQSAIVEVLNNLAGDVTVALPVDVNNPDAYGIEILQPSMGGERVFADLVEGYLSGQIKEVLIGQTATTESTSEGLGTGVSTRHAETMNMLINYDSKLLADSLTWEFIRPLHTMNFGETNYYPRWEFATEDVDSEKWVEGVKKFVEMGGTVPERQVRERMGIDEPKDGEPVMVGSFGADLETGLPLGGGGGATNFPDVTRARKTYVDGIRAGAKK